MHIATVALFVLFAQSPADPSGHWEGVLHIPGRELNFEVDLGKNANQQFIGTISIASQGENGVPLPNIVVEGAKVSFGRSDQPFHGVVSKDGKSMSGDYSISGFTLPFDLARTGEARIEPPPVSPRIGKEFEGTWNATLQGSTARLRFVLTMSNKSDGTSLGSMVSLDEGGLEFPIAIAQEGTALTLKMKSVGSSFTGNLNADSTEISGTFSQRDFSAPLTFQRGTVAPPAATAGR